MSESIGISIQVNFDNGDLALVTPAEFRDLVGNQESGLLYLARVVRDLCPDTKVIAAKVVYHNVTP